MSTRAPGDQLASVDRRLYQQISNRTETDALSELERVSARVSTVESDLKRFRSYAEAQAALGRLYDAVGIDPVPDTLASLDIVTLSEAIRRYASDWDNKRLDRETPAAALPAVTATADAGTTTARDSAQQHRVLAADDHSVVQ